MHKIFPCALIATAISLAGCAVGPDFKKPVLPDIARYITPDFPEKTESTTGHNGAAQQFVKEKAVPEEWWKEFGSEPLNQLVERSLANNPDLKSADASLRIAQETYYAARGDLLPSVDAKFSPLRQRFNPASFGNQGTPSSIFTLYNASVNISYGLDVFGGTRRAIEGVFAEASYQRFERRAAYLTLIANVVTASIQEASLAQQIRETQNIIDIEKKQLEVLKRQLAFGGVPKSTVLAQEAIVAQTETNLPVLEKQLAQQHNQILVLAGEFPGNDTHTVFELAELKLPEELPLSLPSKLVEDRPDIRAAEERLHEASAAIGVATANMLPKITLTGGYGGETNAFSKLFTSGAEVWSIGGSILQPLFHGGSLLHTRRATVAAYDKAVADYQSVVLNAFKNVADTLRALQFDADGLAAQVTSEAAAKNNLDLAQTQFSAGAISYPQLLDAQRTYQQARIGLVQAQAARLVDTVALFQALGGNVQDIHASASAAPTLILPKPSSSEKKL